jgi:hypothetical protein
MGVASFNLTLFLSPVVDFRHLITVVLAHHGRSLVAACSVAVETPGLRGSAMFEKAPGSLDGDQRWPDLWGAPPFPGELPLRTGDYTMLHEQAALDSGAVVPIVSRALAVAESSTEFYGERGRVAVSMWGRTRVVHLAHGALHEAWLLREWLPVPAVWEPLLRVVCELDPTSRSASISYISRCFAWSDFNGTFDVERSVWRLKSDPEITRRNACILASSTGSLRSALSGTGIAWNLETARCPDLTGQLRELCTRSLGPERIEERRLET